MTIINARISCKSLFFQHHKLEKSLNKAVSKQGQSVCAISLGNDPVALIGQKEVPSLHNKRDIVGNSCFSIHILHLRF